MQDINLILRQAYYSILNNNITIDGAFIPIYYQLVPGNYPERYILIQSINSTGNESKTNQQRITSIQLVVYTRYERNDSIDCDFIAGRIFELCYPQRKSVIPGCKSMHLVNDLSNGGFDPVAKKQIAERIITFSHIINN